MYPFFLFKRFFLSLLFFIIAHNVGYSSLSEAQGAYTHEISNNTERTEVTLLSVVPSVQNANAVIYNEILKKKEEELLQQSGKNIYQGSPKRGRQITIKDGEESEELARIRKPFDITRAPLLTPKLESRPISPFPNGSLDAVPEGLQ